MRLLFVIFFNPAAKQQSHLRDYESTIPRETGISGNSIELVKLQYINNID